MIGDVGSALGAWGKPPDAVAWAALFFAAVFAVSAVRRHEGSFAGLFHVGKHGLSRRRFLTITGFAAAFLSLGYIAFYLRGGPRIIDATSYWLQGRALAHGHVSWPVVDPTASFRGRFLLFHEPNLLSGIFPPGYPLLLAAGFWIGAPMVIGPVLAATLAVSTYVLAREVALHHARSPEAETVARFAVLLSLVCAALRYHTADTMSHGASALGITLAMATALRAVRLARPAWLVATGLAIGAVAATRMVSALPIAAGVLILVLGRSPRAQSTATWRERARAILAVLLGIAPGLLFLLCAQHAATGHWFGSTQLAYYAVSDGPPGCFRYGFGQGIGCLVEHGDFVRARLPHGYGLLEAAGTTLRRLWLHTGDVVNFEPLVLVLLLPAAHALRTSRACRMLALVVGLQIVAYAPFYFDGNYPGGGARFFADVLPLEHALLAFALVRMAHAGTAHDSTDGRVFAPIFTVLAVAAFGFAIHTAHGHHALAERDGGRPMYEPDRAREAGLTQGLLFFDTDHGFNLAYDPALSASHGVLAVRRRHDDGDRLLYDMLGHPISHHYTFVPEPGGASSIETWIPPAILDDTYRFEAETEWPPLAQTGGHAQAIFAAGTGASEDRVLELVPDGPEGEASAEIALPLPSSPPIDGASTTRFSGVQGDARSTFVVEPRVLRRGTGARGSLILYTATDGFSPRIEKARWDWSDEPSLPEKPGNILDLAGRTIILDGASQGVVSCRMVLRAQHGAVALDKTTVKAHR
ncbi:ArnT family glycosyltransferase [Pendulispora albinea]|uniref:Glycosyltransferase RgtA/B/C/D-like domain-containing protein n=1 Tax=Pendulispora albinea TaxID=2741071 RepID=A0ABZ2LMY5_9BACT